MFELSDLQKSCHILLNCGYSCIFSLLPYRFLVINIYQATSVNLILRSKEKVCFKCGQSPVFNGKLSTQRQIQILSSPDQASFISLQYSLNPSRAHTHWKGIRKISTTKIWDQMFENTTCVCPTNVKSNQNALSKVNVMQLKSQVN